MDSMEQAMYDPLLLSRIVDFLSDHFDLVNLSEASKFHREIVLQSVQKVTCRRTESMVDLPSTALSLRELSLSPVSKHLSDTVFRSVLPQLSQLQKLEILFSYEPKYQLEPKILSYIGTLPQLRVLKLSDCFLDDEIVRKIAKKCVFLEDLWLEHARGDVSSEGLADLLLNSPIKLKSLALYNTFCFKRDALAAIVKCSTLTSLDLNCQLGFESIGRLHLPVGSFNLQGLQKLRLRNMAFNRMEDLVTAAAHRSPLNAIDFDNSVSTATLLSAVSACRTLQSLHLFSFFPGDVIEHIVSGNRGLIDFYFFNPDSVTKGIMAEKVLSAAEIEERNHAVDKNAIFDFFQRNDLGFLSVKSGQTPVSKLQFISNLEFGGLFPSEETFEGLHDLLSVCTFMERVKLEVTLSDGSNSFQFCRSLGPLSMCHNLTHLSAPLGDNSLRHILKRVKGLRELVVMRPAEDFTDESLSLLKDSAPLLRLFALCYDRSHDGGITDAGLESLSFCTQLQNLSLVNTKIDGPGLIHIASKCMWLNALKITSGITKMETVSRVVKELDFTNKGCSVAIDVSLGGSV